MKAISLYCKKLISQCDIKSVILFFFSLPMTMHAQVNFPDLVIENLNLIDNSSGPLSYCNYNCIVSPSTPSAPVSFSQNATMLYDSYTCIELNPGFQVSSLTNAGYFQARIQPKTIDVVVIAPTITPGEVGELEKLELGIKLPNDINDAIENYFTNVNPSAPKINPYDPDQIHIQAQFDCSYGPCSQPYIVDGFFYREYQENSSNGWDEITTNSYNWTEYPFRIRFLPPYEANWRASIGATINPSIPVNSVGTGCITFESVSSNNPGLLKVGNMNRYLKFSKTNESFFAIGQNIAWPQGAWEGSLDSIVTPLNYVSHRNQISNLADDGGNYTRVWAAPASFGIEWEKLGDYDAGQARAYELDRLFDLARLKNVYIQLCLEPAYCFSTTNVYWADDTRFLWQNNPYNNNCNGNKDHGLVPNVSAPMDFFSDTDAKKNYKNKLRYIIARWGYSTNLGVLEFFNEVNAVDNYDDYYVYNWHSEMSQFIKSTLNDNHLLTSSYSASAGTYNVFELPTIDVSQSHIYKKEKRVNYVHRFETIQDDISAFDKPTLIGETGADPDGEAIASCSPNPFHTAIWASAFMGGYGTALYWQQWQSDDRRNNFKALSSFFNSSSIHLDFELNDFTPRRWREETLGWTITSCAPSLIKTENLLENYNYVNNSGSKAFGWVHNATDYWADLSSCTSISAPCDDDAPTGPVVIDPETKIKIKGLQSWTQYQYEFYRAPYDGTYSLYAWGFETTNLFGELRYRLATDALLEYAPDYAYKVFSNGERSEEPLETDTIGCPYDTIHVEGIYSNDPDGSFQYYWDFGNGVTSNNRFPTIFYTSPGTYTVALVVSDSTTNLHDTLVQDMVVLDCDTSNNRIAHEDKIINDGVLIYPNPTNGLLNILLSESNNSNTTILIYDVVGKLLIEEKNISRRFCTIDMSTIKPGVYFVEIQNPEETIIEKIILQ